MVNDKVNKTITVYVPGNICNLRCSYCYVSQCYDESHGQKATFQYPVETMVAAFSPERIGGLAHIGVIGAGETLIPDEVIPFVHGLLDLGHVVEVVTNNTLNKKIDQLLNTSSDNLKRLIVKCSLHYLELKRLNLVDDYFNNMIKIRNAGASTYSLLVLSNDYMPYIDEICKISMQKLGVLPHCTPCLKFENREDILNHGSFATEPPCTSEFVKEIDEKFNSAIFREAVRWLSIDVSKIYCYAGSWSFVINMEDGKMAKCHNVNIDGNFFENINEKVQIDPVAYSCGVCSCCLQYNFIAFGLIPEIKDSPTYASMLERNTINDTAKYMLDVKFSDFYPERTSKEKELYLLDGIKEKEQLVNELGMHILKQEKLIKLYREKLNNEEKLIKQLQGKNKEELFEELMQLFEQEEISYEKIEMITYDQLYNFFVSCKKEEGQMELYDEVFNILYQIIIKTIYIDDSTVCYFNKHIDINVIGKIPITEILFISRNFEHAINATRKTKMADEELLNILHCSNKRLFSMED